MSLQNSQDKFRSWRDETNGKIYVVTPTYAAPIGFTYVSVKKDGYPVSCYNGAKNVQSKHTEIKCKDTTIPAKVTLQENGLHLAPSLLTLCIDFVAQHIQQVDSLIDFPDQMGKLLFDAVIACELIQKPGDDTRNVLNLFSDAYGSNILTELHLTAGPLLSQELLWQCFPCLTKLDMTSCNLGDHHHMLTITAQLKRLTHLNLKDNFLSDEGVRKLSSPARICGTGLKNLQVLVLASNALLTDACVKYLYGFSQLDKLDLSDTQVTTTGIKKLGDKLGLEKQLRPVPELCVTNLCETRGWAADVVSGWFTEELTIQNKVEKAQHATRHTFYSKRQKNIEKVSISSEVLSQETTLTRSNTLHLCASQNSANKTIRTRKRKRKPCDEAGQIVSSSSFSDDCEGQRRTKKIYDAPSGKKRQLTQEESDIFSGYLGAVQSPSGGDQHNLWNVMQSGSW